MSEFGKGPGPERTSPQEMLTDEMRKRAQFILENLGFKSFVELKDKSIADIGCGRAEFGNLASANGSRVTSIDAKDQSANVITTENHQFIQAFANKIPLENNSQDFIVSHAGPLSLGGKEAPNSVPVVVEEAKNSIREYLRILKPTGKIRIDASIDAFLWEYIEEHRSELPEKYPMKDFSNQKMAEISLEKVKKYGFSAQLIPIKHKRDFVLEITKQAPEGARSAH